MNQSDLKHDLNADHYVKNSSLQNNLAKEILTNLSINSTASILDVGCGDGRITSELANYAKKGTVVGLDPSPSMIEFASHNFSKTQFPNLDFYLGAAEEASFACQFDLIVSFSCFHWLKNPTKAIQKLSSVLKENGEVLILTYPQESPYYQYLQRALKNYPKYSHLSANNTMLSTEGYKNLFSANKLCIADFEVRNLFAIYNSTEELKNYIKGWIHNYICLPENLYENFIDEIIYEVMNDNTICKEKQIKIPYTALIIRAQKQ